MQVLSFFMFVVLSVFFVLAVGYGMSLLEGGEDVPHHTLLVEDVASLLDHAAVSVLRCNRSPQPRQLVMLCP